MQYRKFGKLDWKVSALGFGSAKLPTLDGELFSDNVDEDKTIELVRYAIENGINYFDVWHHYYGGKSERIIGKAFAHGYREKVKIIAKMPVWQVTECKDLDTIFEEQRDRLQTDYIDICQLHALDAGSQGNLWERIKEIGVIRWAEKRMAKGDFHYFGFSFHGEYVNFKKVIDDYDNWTNCTILYNFIDQNIQAGQRGLEYAFDRNIAVSIMEPLRGGGLACNVPRHIRNLWDTATVKRTPAEWALQWLWNQQQISVVLCGMDHLELMKQNIASAGRSEPGTLSDEELNLINRVRIEYLRETTIQCGKCNYCIPCPKGIAIPRIFEFYNESIMFNDINSGKLRYNTWLAAKDKGNNCVECSQCVKRCPRRLEIPKLLDEIHRKLNLW
jgi:predicted aldo/keto reductase-like oxidoreductase